MKNKTFILLIILLSSCSAQRQLNTLLARHPELKTNTTITIIDTIIIKDTIILEADSAVKEISLQDILLMDSIAGSAEKETHTESQARGNKQTDVKNKNSAAVLSAKGNGKFLLKAISPIDTIYITDTVYKEKNKEIPTLLTDTKIEYKEIYKLYWWQKILIWFGAISILITISYITYLIVAYKLRK
ncbi:MAG: hypothetical protein IJS05_07715 [Paludibacteraceae bacterium]|nr:hypothetical protein [Paludibacteraceae bacterium]